MKRLLFLVLMSGVMHGAPITFDHTFARANIGRWLQQAATLEKTTDINSALSAIPERDLPYVGSLAYGEGRPTVAKQLQARFDVDMPTTDKIIIVFSSAAKIFLIKEPLALR